MSINRVNISGNLTRDSELRSLPSGTQVLSFGVAVNDRRRNPQTGEWEDYPNYVDCSVFGARAQALSQYLLKGTKVAIEGKLRWSSWEKNGERRSKLEVMVDELEFLSSRNNNAAQAAPAPQYAPQQQQMYANPPQPQMAPQMAPQAPAAPPVPQGYGYQQQMPQQPPAQQALYDEDIPFSAPILPY